MSRLGLVSAADRLITTTAMPMAIATIPTITAGMVLDFTGVLGTAIGIAGMAAIGAVTITTIGMTMDMADITVAVITAADITIKKSSIKGDRAPN